MANVRIGALHKSYGSVQAVRGVDLDIPDGEFTVLVGPSGCGKSTLLRTIAGLEDADSGDIEIGGEIVNHLRPRDRYVAESKRLLAVLDQQLAKYPWIAGDDYSIADIATFPWINNLIGFYGAADLVGIEAYAQVRRALQAFLARPAVSRGLGIPKRS